jgi:hypothetical protein
VRQRIRSFSRARELAVCARRHPFDSLEGGNKGIDVIESHGFAYFHNFQFVVFNQQLFGLLDSDHVQVVEVVGSGLLFEVSADVLGI